MSEVQSALGHRQAVRDSTLIPDEVLQDLQRHSHTLRQSSDDILQDQIAETVSSTTMVAAQIVSWIVGGRRDAEHSRTNPVDKTSSSLGHFFRNSCHVFRN